MSKWRKALYIAGTLMFIIWALIGLWILITVGVFEKEAHGAEKHVAKYLCLAGFKERCEL